MLRIVDRQNVARCADWFAIAIALVLPWSTTFTAVFVVLWFFSLVGSWNISERLREPWLAVGYLPALLWLIAALGMLWASVPWGERFAAFSAFHKLLAIPFFAIQFRDSHRGTWVLIAFLMSCTVLLILSWALILLPDLPWRGRERVEGVPGMIGVPVKDYNAQTTMFTLCIIGLAESAFRIWHKGKRSCAFFCVLLGTIFFANTLYAAPSRTALVVLPLLLVLFAFMRLSWKSAGALLIAIVMVLAAAWRTSDRLRERTADLFEEVRTYQTASVPTSAGYRLVFWRKSIDIIADAPFVGHGTGSIQQQFRQSAAGKTGMAGLVTADPHNQIFGTSIQLGLIGTVALWAMWIAHLVFFCAQTLPGDRACGKTLPALSSTRPCLIRRMVGFTSSESAFLAE
jgi:O-antigen ligase